MSKLFFKPGEDISQYMIGKQFPYARYKTSSEKMMTDYSIDFAATILEAKRSLDKIAGFFINGGFGESKDFQDAIQNTILGEVYWEYIGDYVYKDSEFLIGPPDEIFLMDLKTKIEAYKNAGYIIKEQWIDGLNYLISHRNDDVNK